MNRHHVECWWVIINKHKYGLEGWSWILHPNHRHYSSCSKDCACLTMESSNSGIVSQRDCVTVGNRMTYHWPDRGATWVTSRHCLAPRRKSLSIKHCLFWRGLSSSFQTMKTIQKKSNTIETVLTAAVLWYTLAGGYSLLQNSLVRWHCSAKWCLICSIRDGKLIIDTYLTLLTVECFYSVYQCKFLS